MSSSASPAASPAAAKAVTVRRARTTDVAAVRRLVDPFVRRGILLDKATVTLYESIQEFWVAERDEDAVVVGCGALHVMWEDLAEVRTLAVDPEFREPASDIRCWTSCCTPPDGSGCGGYSA